MIPNEEIYNNGWSSSGTEQTESPLLDHKLKTSDLIQLNNFAHAALFKTAIHPWEVLPMIEAYVKAYIASFNQERRPKIATVGSVFIDDDVIIGEGTTIEHGAMIKGPTIIGRNCQIRKGAYLRGNVITGDDCIIGNSTELKNCVVLNKAQICHFNYVGDSVLGEGAHLSAGAITSNLKLDHKEVVLRIKQSRIETGLKKFGAIVGDYCEVGCNVVLNPGTILGRRSVVYPGASVRGVVPAEHILKVVQEQVIVKKV